MEFLHKYMAGEAGFVQHMGCYLLLTEQQPAQGTPTHQTTFSLITSQKKPHNKIPIIVSNIMIILGFLFACSLAC